VSHKGLARRVVELGTARGVRGLAYDHSSVARWLAGEQPREPAPGLISDVLAGLLHQRLAIADLGMVPSAAAADTGLTLAGTWTQCVTAATTLWSADADQSRFLTGSSLAVSASQAVALQWLVSPVPDPPSWPGRRLVGEPELAAIKHVVASYRELDNRLGGGRVRGAVVHYLNTEVAPLLADGRFDSKTGQRLAAAGAELARWPSRTRQHRRRRRRPAGRTYGDGEGAVPAAPSPSPSPRAVTRRKLSGEARTA
jgi:hypothetical protein